MLGMLGRKDIDHVAAHAENSAVKVHVVALVLHLGQALDDRPLVQTIADAHRQDHVVILVTIADAVDAGNGGHDHHIAPLDQAFRGRQPHLLDVIVDRAVLLDIEVTRRHVGLGLIIVIIRNEIFHRIFRKEFLELGVQLGSERLVWSQHQRWPTGAGNHIRHRISLAGARHPEQDLIGQPIGEPFDQQADRLGLVACGGKGWCSRKGLPSKETTGLPVLISLMLEFYGFARSETLLRGQLFRFLHGVSMSSSIFAAVEMAPRDPILGLNEAFNADPRDTKVNLGVGVL